MTDNQMKSITDTTYYEIDTEAFEYSPYAPVSEERIKLEKQYWKSKSSQDYYEYMRTGILETLKTFGLMFEIITTEILNKIRYTIFTYPFNDGATCKKLRVFYNANKQQIQIDWKFAGETYVVYV